MKSKYTLLCLGLLLSLSGCASRESSADTAPIFIIDTFEVWHNLMPGGQPALFFTAVVKLERRAETIADSVQIERVSLFKGETESAHFKATFTDISDEYPDSVSNQWYIYRLVPEQGYAAFNSDDYNDYTVRISLSGKFGRIKVAKTGVNIQKVY